MRFFNDMRIRNKILVGYLAAVLAVVGVAILSWRHMTATDHRFQQVLGHDIPQILGLEHLRDSGMTLIHAVDVFANRTAVNRLRTYTVSTLDAERADMRDAERDLSLALTAFSQMLQGAGAPEADPRRRALAAAGEILGYPAALLELVDRGATVSELIAASRNFDGSAEKFRSLIDVAIDREEIALRELSAQAQAARTQATWEIGGGIFIVIVLTLAGGYLIANRIARPVLKLRSAMARIGAGDHIEMDEEAGQDEVGELVAAFRNMVARLNDAALELRESEIKFRTLVGNIPGVFYRCANDAAYTMEFISSAIQDISGYPASDFFSNRVRTYASIIHPDDVALVDKTVGDALSRRRAYAIEYRIVHQDGSIRWVNEHGQGIFGNAGELLHLDGSIFDVTERHRMESELREALDTANDAMDKLSRQERLAALGQVAGTVSHELRNPLASIRNSMALIRQMTTDKGLGVERALDRVERNIARCNTIISDLLEFTRKREMSRTSTPIDGWLAEMLDEHSLSDGVVVQRELFSTSIVALDRDRFRQVMVNLLDNAAQAMIASGWSAPDGRQPTIVVKTEEAGPHVRVSVADNGPGIAPDNLAKVFEPLFTTKSFGVGLGLPTVRTIVEQHGGTIDVESAVEVGTTFVVWLPRQSGDAALPDSSEKEAAA